MTPHWTNPWSDAVPVPVEELAAILVRGGARLAQPDGSWAPATLEQALAAWGRYGNALDGYILPKKLAGYHQVGIRFGEEGSSYLSPSFHDHQAEIEALLEKHAS